MPTSEFTAPVREPADKPSPALTREGRSRWRWVKPVLALAWLAGVAVGAALFVNGIHVSAANDPATYEYGRSLASRGCAILIPLVVPVWFLAWLDN